jgi:hypothetical protein
VLFRFTLFITFLFFSLDAHPQRQLLVLKKEKVLLRLNYGDQIVFRLKGDKQIKRSYVNNIYDTAIKVHLDTIPLRKIDRIYFKQSHYTNVLGGLLVTGGAAFFVIDQFNEVVVHGNKASIDNGVVKGSAIMIGVGLPMMLIRKKSQRIGYPTRLLIAKKGSPFYVTPRNENLLIDIPEN